MISIEIELQFKQNLSAYLLKAKPFLSQNSMFIKDELLGNGNQ